jgi:hypothetical protein
MTAIQKTGNCFPFLAQCDPLLLYSVLSRKLVPSTHTSPFLPALDPEA